MRQDVFAMVNDEAAGGDEVGGDLGLSRPARADDVDMGSGPDLGRRKDRIGRGGHRADDVGAGQRLVHRHGERLDPGRGGDVCGQRPGLPLGTGPDTHLA